ncbi:L-aspartate oxidase [Psychrobacter sp. ANT_H56B]|uniref:L-aspartate oxidase n=1 Tax=Psychrobacter sp. ANT_H56B TaxID=2597353 RepID=UPI0011F0E86F|nr:L-aspartate oxidase [Psychrobacter sp. ANT_H56B]KAA0924196.1 L-aspartate oxidase [Psychrobacter sp. ANT_H56B]
MSALCSDSYADSNGADSTNEIRTDVLIIGAGLAGLSTALALPKTLKVIVLSKAALEVCSSHYAQGGIAASLDKDDCVADHIADTLVAGAGLCETNNTASILSQGQQAVQWLCTQGVPFTQIPLTDAIESLDAIKTLDIKNLHLTKEGGHGCRRVAHADDATGRHVMDALILKAQAASNITILTHYEALSILTKSSDDRCQGATVFDHCSQSQLTIYSSAVVLASGGLGQLFQRASAPNVCVGDGVIMAWQAGCRLANLEFVQFHPTGLALADSSFLISEALRGEGGRLYCPKTGTRFMLEIDARAELAPRDIVARAIATQIHTNRLGYVHLDVSHLPADFIQQHFPQIYQTVLALGIDITTDPIPVAPTAHYSCGGIVTCSNGLTDVPGLYAAGEVAYTGLHGANRLASNSLLECVVVGRNIAAHLPNYLTNNQWTAPLLTDTKLISLPLTTVSNKYSSEKKHSFETSGIETVNIETTSIKATDIVSISMDLKALMSSHLGITRDAQSLEQALIQINKWQQALESSSSPTLTFENSPHLNTDEIAVVASSATLNALHLFQLTRQLQLAALIVHSAYQRCESRGGHYRQDYPYLADTPKVSVIEPKSKPNSIHDELQLFHEMVS